MGVSSSQKWSEAYSLEKPLDKSLSTMDSWKQFQEKSIELILCANTIPNERKIFLENVGIECKEIPVSQLVNIADKYQYTFLDTKKHESEDLDLSVIQSTDSDSTSDEITTWIFQANPKEYDILNALSDEKLEKILLEELKGL